ncbi:MAG: glycosyltransferase family 2 protein [Rubrivivax sp.]|nr:MAG: glycosyltransferase family 2 protein [Rubrivivax sp.]
MSEYRPSPSQKTFSVVICNYNYQDFIEQAIDSVLNQTVPVREIVVVDDGSTDGSRALIQRYADRVKVIFKENGGQISAYNEGFPHTTADFVIFLDSDDYLAPDCVETLLGSIQDDVVKLHWRMALVDSKGQTTGASIPSQLFAGVGDQALLSKGVVLCSSPGSGNAYRADMLRRVMPLPADAIDKHGADFFAVRAAAWLGRIAAIENRPLGYYRIHSEGDVASLVFGNAAKKKAYTYQQRVDRFKTWFSVRCPDLASLVPSMEIDFSMEKQQYALSIFNQTSYLKGVQSGLKSIKPLLVSIQYRPGGELAKAALAFWAVFVLLAPRRMGTPVARYVCNPARRT